MSGPSSQLTSVLVRAGAGAGKTTELTERVLRFALTYRERNKRWPRIVISTFTRKATQELRERLTRKACEKQDWELLNYFSSPSQIHISTIHGVLSLYLRRYGRLAGLDPSFSIVSDKVAGLQLRKIVRHLLFERSEYSLLLDEFRVGELLAVLRQHYPLWMTSSGKMESLSWGEAKKSFERRLADLITGGRKALDHLSRVGLSPDYVEYERELALLLSELEELRGALGENISSADLLVELDRLTESWPARPSARKKENKELASLLGDEVKDLEGDKEKFFSDALQELSLWPKWDELKGIYQGFSEQVFQQWREQKYLRGQLQMQDLELFGYEILEKHPETAESFAQDWDYWLIDEYQDTSPLQDRLMKSLMGDSPVFFVGDPQQSIYLFRGARYENFADKQAEFEAAKLEVQLKNKHYRSRGELLEFFNDFFSFLDARYMWMEPQRPIGSAAAKVVEFCVLEKDSEIEDAELHKLAEKIRALLEQGVAPQKIAVLGRVKTQLHSAYDFLKARSFPVQLQSAAVFQDRREILDLACFLKFLLNPHDNANLVSLLRSPWWKAGDVRIAAAAAKKKSSLWISFSQDSEFAGDEIIQRLKTLRLNLNESSLSLTVENWIRDSGFMDWCRAIDPSGRREANIWKWFANLKQAERQPGFSYLSWLDEMQGDPDIEADNQEGDALSSLEPDRIQIMTVHAAKGLEFDHVLIPFCGKGRRPPDLRILTADLHQTFFSFRLKDEEIGQRRPSLWALERIGEQQSREDEESLRVLYVAMTRAKESLTLIGTLPGDAKSWLQPMMRWMDQAGENSGRPYKFVVDREVREAQKFERAVQDKIQVRERFAGGEALSSDVARKKSVSQLLTEENAMAAAKQKIDFFAGLSKAQEGVLIHKVFESLQLQGFEALDALLERYFDGTTAQLRSDFEWALELREPGLRHLIAEGHVEWGFHYKTPVGLLEGQIDLWGFSEDGETLWVCDYKSGSSKYTEQALRQLWLYSWPLRHLYPDKKIRFAVIYLKEKKVIIKDSPVHEPKWTPENQIQNWPNF